MLGGYSDGRDNQVLVMAELLNGVDGFLPGTRRDAFDQVFVIPYTGLEFFELALVCFSGRLSMRLGRVLTVDIALIAGLASWALS